MKKTTLFLVLIALGLGGYVYWYEIKPQSQEETVTDSQQGLFSFEEDQVQKITIEREGKETLKFIRLETAASSWRMKQPEGTPVADSSIVFLLNLLIRDDSNKTFTVQTNQLEQYGLKNPSASISIELKDQTKHKIILGNPTFDEQGIYGQINPEEEEETKVYILPIDFKSVVERPLSEWKLTAAKT
ncbi:DUF4340 domain-containing protein [Dactylococcopsis salina]|uniref:DUF4340 domain-containing protein n=1 Tax=Dactylococcopsis salina (strain PCC 8305) TaxID=13035 RepID=K9YTQ0_DACS8|nr:DUF4340 domain-containing protein [Dactylococcopsis salina]AFZ50311.1 hypothetical protein Dacsa_1641 [Dactylococcopsis salina PCC 8305]